MPSGSGTIGKDGRSRSRGRAESDDEENDVKSMFKKLMVGQEVQAAASRSLEVKMSSMQNDVVALARDMTERETRTHARIDQVAMTMNEKMTKMQQQINDMQNGDARSEASTAAPMNVSTATPTASRFNFDQDDSKLKVVVGGWSSPQRKHVIENRLQQLSEGYDLQDLFARKRGTVGFLVFKEVGPMLRFLKKFDEIIPTGIEGDPDMWAKRSLPLDQRKKSAHARCLARALHSHWEAAGGKAPSSFMMDYYRKEAIMDDDVVAAVAGDSYYCDANNWRKHFGNVPFETIKARALAYLSSSSE